MNNPRLVYANIIGSGFIIFGLIIAIFMPDPVIFYRSYDSFAFVLVFFAVLFCSQGIIYCSITDKVIKFKVSGRIATPEEFSIALGFINVFIFIASITFIPISFSNYSMPLKTILIVILMLLNAILFIIGGIDFNYFNLKKIKL